MRINTSNPAAIARHILVAFNEGQGAEIVLEGGNVLWFAPAHYFRDESRGLFVSCASGGGAIFESISSVTRYACVTSGMSLAVGVLIEKIVTEMVAIREG